MRIKVVLHYLGLIVGIIGLSMLAPIIASLIYGDSDTSAFLISMGICLLVSFILWQRIRITDRKLWQKEALLLVVSGWIFAAFFGSLPFALSGAMPNFLDAFFEGMSGFTTTGATVFSSLETQPHGILLWRSLMQWLGGMGIIMLFVALFPALGIGAAHLAEAETPGAQQGEKLTSRMRETARILWFVYMGLTAAELILLVIARMPFFDALCVTLSTIPIGGFVPHDLSIAAYNSIWVEGIVILFMLASGVNFSLYFFLLWKRQPSKLFKNPEFKLYITLILSAIVIINFDLIANFGMSLAEAFRYGSFQAVSIMTTTGFSTANFDAWPNLSRALLLILMVIGASAGSTGGALKVIRLLVLFKYSYRRIRLAFNPSAVIPLKVGGKVIPDIVTSRVISLTILYFGIIWGGFLVMSALGLDFTTALSSVTAALGNVGPGLGMVGPAETYASLPEMGKGVIIFCMLAGRLELFTLFVLFLPSFWKWH